MKRGNNKVKTALLHEMELRKHRMKVKDQEKELKLLTQENLDLRKSLESLGQVHTAYMIALALKYGAKTGEGAVELTIPALDVQTLVKDHRVSAGRTERGDTVIRLDKK